MSATKYLKSIAPLILPKEFDGVDRNSSSVLFRLHCKFTTAVLISFSMLLYVREYFGKPIDCITDLPKNAVNTYCWITSTFTMPDYYFRDSGIHPGLYTPRSYDDEEAQRNWRFHNYYQWVVFVLFFMGGLCYAPNYIWKKLEGGMMKCLCDKMSRGILTKENVAERNKAVLEYMQTHLKMMDGYFYKYCGCEFLCFLNIILQMVFVDYFLNGEFWTYGGKVIDFSNMDQKERVDPMIYVFPRLTKCHFHLFGPSGTIRRTDALCLLAHNILNEKIFIFVWFWYIALLVLLMCLIIFRLGLYLSPSLRIKVITSHNKMIPSDKLSLIVYQTSIGDWWLLYLLSGTLDSIAFRDLIHKLFEDIESKDTNSKSPYPNLPSAPFSTSSV